MKKNVFKTTALVLLLTMLFSANVFAAGQLTQDDTGIHYLKEDGTFAVSTWVEVSNTWFLFDANGVCVNPLGAAAPNDADGCYQLMTSYVPFDASNPDLTSQCIANGTVVEVNGQYFITPEAATVMRNANRTTATVPATPAVTQTPAVTETPVITETPTTTETSATTNNKVLTPETIGWLSATGNYFHSINNCGRMNPNKARQVTYAEALASGHSACSKCW